MRRSLPIGIVAAAFFLFLHAQAARAGIESWVSGTGTDTGTCPRTAPCRTFAYAHGQTTAQGAINVLTSGNFGPLTITKAISIVADGVEAVINTALPSNPNPAAIAINVGATAIVSLRGLTIDMRGTSNEAISFLSGKALHLQNSVIRKTLLGIRFVPASGTSELHIADSAFEEATNGVFIRTTGSVAITAAFDRVRVENGAQNGIILNSDGLAITATLRNSVVAGNGATGVTAGATGSGAVDLAIERTALVNNNDGIDAFSGATIRLGHSTLTGNVAAIGANPVFSYGTNRIDGNGTDGALTLIPTK